MPMGDWPMTIALRALAAGAALATVLATHAEADAVSDFYKGRTVTIVVGNEVGTAFDVYGRTLARYLGSHLPGRPNVVVQNMVGASGIAAAIGFTMSHRATAAWSLLLSIRSRSSP